MTEQTEDTRSLNRDWENYQSRLKASDSTTCRDFFNELWPVAWAVVSGSHLDIPDEYKEDIVMKAINSSWDTLLASGCLEECKAFLAKIAYQKAISTKREQTADKRNESNTESVIDSTNHGEADNEQMKLENKIAEYPAEQFQLSEIYELLCSQLKTKEHLVIDGLYLKKLTPEEISEKYKIPIKSVGVLASRAIVQLNGYLDKNPQILKEISD